MSHRSYVALMLIVGVPFTCFGLMLFLLVTTNFAALITYILDAKEVWRGLVVSLIVGLSIIGLLYVAGLALTSLARRWRMRHVIYSAPDGTFPLLPKSHDLHDLTPEGVRALAAWTASQAQHGIGARSAATRAAFTAALQPSSAASSTVVESSAEPLEVLPVIASYRDIEARPTSPELPVGKDSASASVWWPIRGHILVAGATEQGKTNLFATWMRYVISNWPSGAVQFAYVDIEKGVDIYLPDNLAALWAPVAKRESESRSLIDWIAVEVQERYDRMQQFQVSDILALNAAMPERSARYRPLLVFIDEMWTFRRMADYESRLLRLAKTAAAGSVHLVMGTQRPSDISRDVRMMAMTRIAFPTASIAEQEAILGFRPDMIPERVGQAWYVRSRDVLRLQTWYAGVREGEFQSAVQRALSLPGGTRAPQRTFSVPVPDVPSDIVLTQRASSERSDYEQEQRRERRWSDFAAAFFAANPEAGVSALARAMAAEDGRLEAWVNYKSEAHRWYHALRGEEVVHE